MDHEDTIKFVKEVCSKLNIASPKIVFDIEQESVEVFYEDTNTISLASIAAKGDVVRSLFKYYTYLFKGWIPKTRDNKLWNKFYTIISS